MTHYQKLAALIFRSIGILLLIIGVVPAVYALLATIAGSVLGMIVAITYSLPIIIIGIILFLFSKKLAQFVCYDFDR